ncbi:hypothetical protein Lepto7376_1120 [[Leptolyngbya] sp. PCC 7376]|uniref:hypothetical protein n=1 Tax=[Leptolyngbya] sp. PCC 7376 TaxID=111781 RepID=UPI00029F16A7|nr:hypothetical protein [[Leptolyngbya] sp. PCC 7376]AFY37488.1 hypothetical protein Lepto7376_1120 [[Leptolyngbya] sp. PCC 7376]
MFGISAAIVAPIGLTLLGYTISRDDSEMINNLSKVPEIEKLINQAKTEEEKIQVLEEERAKLTEIIRIEARRQATLDRN